MRYLIPTLCDRFECIGSRCPDTCCAGWNIYVDQETDTYYQSVTGEIGQKLQEKINRTKSRAYFVLDENLRCPFLNKKNLCSLYLTLGPDSLCGTCKLFPRQNRKYGNLRLAYTSIACPESARMFLSEKQPIEILCIQNEEKEDPSFHAQDDFLLDTLTSAISLVQDRSLSLRQRLSLAVLFYYQQQTCYTNSADYSDVIHIFSNPDLYGHLLDEYQLPDTDFSQRLHLLNLVCPIITINKSEPFLLEIYTGFSCKMEDKGVDQVSQKLEDYVKYFEDPSIQTELENLFVYLLFRYTFSEQEKIDVFKTIVSTITFYITYILFVSMSAVSKNHILSTQERLIVLSRLARYFEHNKHNVSEIYECMKQQHMNTPETLIRLL